MVPFSSSLAEMTSTRRKSPLELTFITYEKINKTIDREISRIIINISIFICQKEVFFPPPVLNKRHRATYAEAMTFHSNFQEIFQKFKLK